jgi:RNA recognition motif-containing protein
MFKEQDSVEKAIAKSEEKLDGRPLLIKNAKNFERKDGLPKPTKTSIKQKNPPCPTLFVGNLSFDTTKESLQELFSWAGDIRQVRLGTFQDSGKCKG